MCICLFNVLYVLCVLCVTYKKKIIVSVTPESFEMPTPFTLSPCFRLKVKVGAVIHVGAYTVGLLRAPFWMLERAYIIGDK